MAPQQPEEAAGAATGPGPPLAGDSDDRAVRKPSSESASSGCSAGSRSPSPQGHGRGGAKQLPGGPGGDSSSDASGSGEDGQDQELDPEGAEVEIFSFTGETAKIASLKQADVVADEDEDGRTQPPPSEQDGPHMEGWLLKRSGGWLSGILAHSLLGTALQAVCWQRRHFLLEPERLCYLARGDSTNPRGNFVLADVDEVGVHGREILLHFAALQRTGTSGRGRTALSLFASSEEEAELWAERVRAAAAELRTGLPLDWDVHDMLRPRSAAEVRLVAKKPLPAFAVSAAQRLVDHAFKFKGTKDRRKAGKDRKGKEVPLRLEVVQVFGVQNVSAWTEYAKARTRVCSRTKVTAEPLRPEVITATIGDPAVTELLGEVDEAANERWLFHGSTPTAVQNITNSEFQINLAGSHRGTLYGKGVYLAECSSKADEYSEVGNDGLCDMLLCRVVLGRVLVDVARVPAVADLTSKCQSGAYNSLCGDRYTAVGTYREFVLFDGNQVYPAYIIRYRRVTLERLLCVVREIDAWSDVDAAVRVVLHAARAAESHPNPAIRASVPMSLRVSVTEVVPAVARVLTDARPAVRRIAAVALGMLRPHTEVVVKALIDSLKDAEEDVRVAASAALGQIVQDGLSELVVPSLRGMLRDESDDVRRTAATSLGALGMHTDSAVSALLEHVEDKAVRHHVILALGALGSRAAQAVPMLVRSLSDESGDMRCAAAKALRQLSIRALPAVPELCRALGDDRADVRKASIEALGRLGNHAAPAASALTERLRDPDDSVRAAAAEVLGQLGRKAAPAVPALTLLLHDESRDVQKAAVIALGCLGDFATGAVPALCFLLQDDRVDVAEAAQEALDKLANSPIKKPHRPQQQPLALAGPRGASRGRPGGGAAEEGAKCHAPGESQGGQQTSPPGDGGCGGAATSSSRGHPHRHRHRSPGEGEEKDGENGAQGKHHKRRRDAKDSKDRRGSSRHGQGRSEKGGKKQGPTEMDPLLAEERLWQPPPSLPSCGFLRRICL